MTTTSRQPDFIHPRNHPNDPVDPCNSCNAIIFHQKNSRPLDQNQASRGTKRRSNGWRQKRQGSSSLVDQNSSPPRGHEIVAKNREIIALRKSSTRGVKKKISSPGTHLGASSTSSDEFLRSEETKARCANIAQLLGTTREDYRRFDPLLQRISDVLSVSSTADSTPQRARTQVQVKIR